ncbi:DUF3102 domain-containing protein [Pseudomonas alcaligenes]|uniref:DUF3102 domain-containing protein n=1 Tax=Aquipseudomonas alcaligenes TaxID=43263 RepID=UPI00358FB68C
MARRAQAGTELAPDAPLDGEVLQQSQNAMGEHLQEVMATFGDGLPYDRLRYIDNTRKHMARSAEEALHAGRCLLVMKEAEPHGEWMHILGELSLEPRLAQRMMQAALKFGGIEPPTKLIEAAKSKSKLFELMVLDDEDLQALNDGGTVAGLELDDIDRMPVSTLRKALREAKEDLRAKDQVLSAKAARVNDLETSMEKLRHQVQAMTPDQHAKALRQEVVALAFEAEADITGKLREGFAKLQEHGEAHGADHTSFKASLVAHLERMLKAIKSEFHLPEVEAGDGIQNFPWLQQEPGEA